MLYSKVGQINRYIIENIDDNCGEWEYTHGPQLKSFINSLNKEDIEELNEVVWDWDERYLFELADPILFSKNENIDISYFYPKIFSVINDLENFPI